MTSIRWAALVLLVACNERVNPPTPAPANLDIIADLPANGVAGSSVGVFTVRVSDAAARPMSGVLVTFAASLGSAQTSPPADTTRADGTVSTAVALGTMPGGNQVSALVTGLPEVRSNVVAATVGGAATVTVSQRVVRITPALDSLPISATARDAFGNVIPGAITWTSRNPALVTPSPATNITIFARAMSRPGRTWIVASAGAASDSILVAVQEPGSSPCAFVTSPIVLAVGESLAMETTGLACVRADASAEYGVIAHYNSPVSSATTTVALAAFGVVPPPPAGAPATAALSSSGERDPQFETALRQREAAALASHVPGARAWQAMRQKSSMAALAAVSREGDVLNVNVNAFDFCSKPTTRTARVMAITSGTIMLEDISNPAGGFSAAEYREMAAAMDTLVLPVDTLAFGAPSDVDNNGRIGVLFTRAVNELTPRNSASGIVLGFFYGRDLLPRSSPFGSCPGSNVGEMFYVLVPDPEGEVSAPRSKAFIQGVVLSTIAHELQHLINASRRIYVNASPSVTEETWLNEGLSHIAEELLFYRVSGLGSRQNIGAGQLTDGLPARAVHDLYMRGNFGRLSQYLQSPESNSPLATNDDLATRGASWSLLRYIADRAGATDGDLWRRLVNSRTTGVVNLDQQLEGTGLTTMTAVRDWSTALFTDDLAATSSPVLSHPSWNYRTAMPQVGISFGLPAPALANGVSSPVPLRAGGSAYLRLAVPAATEALIQVTNGGGLPQPGVRLTLVRIR
ncbi:MAG TPA: hypothetical protein VEB19_17010 [Gemmatimonadaceae bacterium]|nr:hypothetical protein [Gemmatimonadaceae bacterium]